MKKIGILTYHSAINYGAALQCYALRYELEKYGNEVYVLNLVTKIQEENNSIMKKNRGIKSILIQIALLPFLDKRIEKNNNFKQFQEKYFNCTKKVQNQQEFHKLLENEKFDYVFVGSDQVWCPFIEDFTNNFFLPFNMKISKIGYAVSIGKAQKTDLLPFKNYINDFTAIGVREKSAIEVLKEITENKLEEVVDPTLLLSKEEWTSLAEKSNIIIPQKPYIICYFLKKEKFNISYKLAKKIAKEKKLQIYFINQRYSKHSFERNTYYNAGPEDFLKLIKNADFVCTDSFHGTIFSLIFEKQFFTFIESKKAFDRRRQDLLENLQINNRCVFLDDIKICNTQLDYYKLNSKLQKMKNRSINFIRSGLENKEQLINE